MNARFYAPDAHRSGDVVQLPSDEATHLTRVLRLEAGAAIRVFNGRGAEFLAVVEHTSKSGVTVTIGDARPPAAERGVLVTLAQSVLKGDKMDDVVRDAVMMGVSTIQPVVSARSEVTLATLERSRRRERWIRIAIASAKQSGRAVVPGVLAPCTFETLTSASADERHPNLRFLFVEPGGMSSGSSLSDLAAPGPRQATVIVGPEGGWTPEEIALGAATCDLITMRGGTLRADAMPLVAMSALLARWGEL